MPFTASDKIRILKYLGYPPNDVVTLDVRLQIAYNKFGEDIVIETQSILTKLDALDTLESTYATDSQSSLIRADVLEWNPAGRQQNLNVRRNTLIQQLSNIVDLPPNNSMGGVTRIYRG